MSIGFLSARLWGSSHPTLNSPLLSFHPTIYRPCHLFQVTLLYDANKILLLILKEYYGSSQLLVKYPYLFNLLSSLNYLQCLFLQCWSGFYCNYFIFFLGLRGMYSESVSFENERNKRECGVGSTNDRFPLLTPCVISSRVIHLTWL